MKQVGILEAKTHLSKLIDDLNANGHEVEITRHGKPVARITPIGPSRTEDEIEDLIRTAHAIRRSPSNKMTRESVLEGIRDGRRFES